MVRVTMPDQVESLARFLIDVAGGFVAVGFVVMLAVLIVWVVAALLLALLSAVFE